MNLDDNGNVTSDDTNDYTWSYKDELLTSDDGIDDASYLYDHTGDRIQKIVNSSDTTVYLGDYVIAPNGDTEHHLSLNGSPIFERHDDGMTVTDQWIHADHLGSVSAMTDDQGDLTSFKYYEPYGNLLVDEIIGTPPENRFEFTNKERDAETGLSYFEARYLSTDTGRFLSNDPWEGDYYDPQSLNKYAYARNNPVNLYDPTGQWYQYAIQLLRAAVPYLRSALVIGAEAGFTAVDVHDYAKTVSNPNATSSDVLISQAALVTGLATPGGGYSKADNVAKVTGGMSTSKQSVTPRFGWTTEKTLAKSYRDHGKGLGALSVEQYSQMATDFYSRGNSAKSGFRRWVDSEGRVRLYEPETNTLGSYTKDGDAITFMKTRNQNYVNNQAQNWGIETTNVR